MGIGDWQDGIPVCPIARCCSSSCWVTTLEVVTVAIEAQWLEFLRAGGDDDDAGLYGQVQAKLRAVDRQLIVADIALHGPHCGPSQHLNMRVLVQIGLVAFDQRKGVVVGGIQLVEVAQGPAEGRFPLDQRHGETRAAPGSERPSYPPSPRQ